MKNKEPVTAPTEALDVDTAAQSPPAADATGEDSSPEIVAQTPQAPAPSKPSKSPTPGKSYGAKLRAARERMNMLPADIATTLHLEESVVRAIEQARDDELPAAVYVRGYIRAYAGLVGLDADELVAEFAPVEDDPVLGPNPRLVDSNRKNLADLPHRRAGLLFSGIVVTIVLALAGTLWAISKSFDWTFSTDTVAEPAPAWRNETRPPAPTRSPPADVEEQALPEQAAPASTEAATAVAANLVEEQNADPADLEFSFREDSWVEVRDGNGQLLHGAVGRAGKTLDISGDGPFTISIGYAAGVELRHKGEVVALLPHTQDGVARLELH